MEQPNSTSWKHWHTVSRPLKITIPALLPWVGSLRNDARVKPKLCWSWQHHINPALSIPAWVCWQQRGSTCSNWNRAHRASEPGNMSSTSTLKVIATIQRYAVHSLTWRVIQPSARCWGHLQGILTLNLQCIDKVLRQQI